jgi:hypothetical protein
MDKEPNRFALIGYLEEALGPEEMAQIEECLRVSSEWRAALQALLDEVDSGEHSVATIWRRHHLTCPNRERLGAYLLGGLPPDEADYIQFHLEVIKCRWCQANLSDVRPTMEKTEPHDPEESHRRRRIFESSVGLLSSDRK